MLWWDVSIRIDKTLVGGEKPPPPQPIEVLPRLKEALGNAGNWVSQLPGGPRQMVTLRARTGPGEVLLHPLGRLTVKQTVVPLNLEISQVWTGGAGRERDGSRSGAWPGRAERPAEVLKEFFAPGAVH